MTHDELAELMGEPPGGHNSGRVRSDRGAWHSLGGDAVDVIEMGLESVIQTFVHGTRASYNDGCRCPSCMRANRDYMRAYRRRRNT